MVAVILSICAACCFAVGTVLQHQAAATLPKEDSLRPKLLGKLVRKPKWLFANGLDVAGYSFQAVALYFGAVLVVQLVMVCSILLLSLILNAILSHSRLHASDWLGICAITAGLTIFLMVNAPEPGRDTATLAAWIVCLVAAVGVIAIATLFATRSDGARKAVLLALATGVTFALTAALTKTVAHNIEVEGVWTAILTLPALGVVISGGLGILLESSAYHAHKLTASLPSLIVADSLAAAALGSILFQETLRLSGLRVVSLALTIVLMALGIFLLARSPIVAEA